jgi:hypothetical protein
MGNKDRPGNAWQKGQSGNPRGRPPGIHARDLARSHTDAAIRVLVEELSNPRYRVAAAVALLERGWGRPRQEVESLNTNINYNADSGVDIPPRPVTIESATEWLARRRRELSEDYEPEVPESLN